jgi:hypothetical protein
MNENPTAQQLWQLYMTAWRHQGVILESWDMLDDDEQRAWTVFAEMLVKPK